MSNSAQIIRDFEEMENLRRCAINANHEEEKRLIQQPIFFTSCSRMRSEDVSHFPLPLTNFAGFVMRPVIWTRKGEVATIVRLIANVCRKVIITVIFRY